MDSEAAGGSHAGDPAGGNAATSGGGIAGAMTCTDSTSPNAWASWPLPDPTATAGAHARTFTLSAEVATDSLTQLAWQRHTPTETFAWQDAEQYCACLSLEGQDDWHLPSRMELVSIVDYTKHDPSIDEVAFPNTPFEWYWSASPVAGDTRYWYVAFFDGDTHASTPDTGYRVRCVREAAGQTPRYDTSLAGTVTDVSTGLTWQREISAERVTWAAAQQGCATLGLAGGGWRLPGMSELQSLIDESHTDPAIDAAAFPATPSEGFWAATPLAGSATAAWFVSFSEGIAYNAVLASTERVRCVR